MDILNIFTDLKSEGRKKKRKVYLQKKYNELTKILNLSTERVIMEILGEYITVRIEYYGDDEYDALQLLFKYKGNKEINLYQFTYTTESLHINYSLGNNVESEMEFPYENSTIKDVNDFWRGEKKRLERKQSLRSYAKKNYNHNFFRF